jgi:hypothetical protein
LRRSGGRLFPEWKTLYAGYEGYLRNLVDARESGGEEVGIDP